MRKQEEIEMGFFDKIGDIIKVADKVVNNVDNIMEIKGKIAPSDNSGNVSNAGASMNLTGGNNIAIAATSRTVQEYAYGDDNTYEVSFKINDSFKSAESHSGEVEMLYTYAPNAEYGEEGTYPYVAVQLDDDVYNAVAQFKENGSFTGAMDLTPLNGKFYFKAKMNYFNYIMYFYGMDRCDGSWKNNGLCMVYPKAYAGTETERKLMSVLDEVANSYSEII